MPGVATGTRYGYRVDGEWEPTRGLRFNVDKLLLDPYGKAVSGTLTPGPAIFGHDVDDPEERSPLDSAPHVPRSVVVDDAFDWGDDVPRGGAGATR